MKILYYDCFAGISGDMNLGALVDLGVDKDYLIQELSKLSIADEFDVVIRKAEKMSIGGTKVDVILTKEEHEHQHDHHHDNHTHTHDHHHDDHAHQHDHHHDDHAHTHDHHHHHQHDHHHHHEHRNLNKIETIIDDSELNENVKKISKSIFMFVAEAEAKVHGKPVDEVHFHEVGAVDSIVDIVGAAICIDYLKVDEIYSSIVELGGGYVKCAHGTIPVPAPAVVEILKGVPIHKGRVMSETTTPTGAAILKANVCQYGDEIEFDIEKVGYGIGTKDFDVPNVLRVYLGEKSHKRKSEIQVLIETNIDDMNTEIYSYIEEKLFNLGALDVYKTSIIMKKGRPAVKLSVLVEEKHADLIEETIFKETTTLGVRRQYVEKRMLERQYETIQTSYGEVGIKVSSLNGEVVNIKPEYEDCHKLAVKHNTALKSIYDEVNYVIGKGQLEKKDER